MQNGDFDPLKPDCMAGAINKTDQEVTDLIGWLRQALDRAGEYDQGMTVTLTWDEARDLLTVADLLWDDRLGRANAVA